jgi:hypothetical protein
MMGETSSARKPQLMAVLMQFHRIWRWGNMAPLGRPVVPEV